MEDSRLEHSQYAQAEYAKRGTITVQRETKERQDEEWYGGWMRRRIFLILGGVRTEGAQRETESGERGQENLCPETCAQINRSVMEHQAVRYPRVDPE